MSLKGAAYIAGAWEHPTRKAPDKSIALLHAECAKGALEDAGLTKDDIDGYFCAGDAPGALGPAVDGRLHEPEVPARRQHRCRWVVIPGRRGPCDGSHRRWPLQHRADHPGRAAAQRGPGDRHSTHAPAIPSAPGDAVRISRTGPPRRTCTACVRQRHMYEYGTTSEQLAWIKVAASHHAQYNPHAMLRDVVTVEDVVKSPMVSTPLHRLDCCVISDGGGALILTKPEIAKSLKRPLVKVIGVGESPKHQMGGEIDLTYTAARWSGPPAWEMAGIKPSDIKYASIYDSFTITVLMQLEDLGFCEKGAGGKFVSDGNLISGVGKLPFNTDGGGLCSNHPGQPWWHHQDHRGGASASRRSTSIRASPELRPGNRPWHRRSAWDAPLRQHRDTGAGVIDMAYVARKIQFVGTPDTNPETKPFFDGIGRRQADGPPLHKLQERRTGTHAPCVPSASGTATGNKRQAKPRSIRSA